MEAKDPPGLLNASEKMKMIVQVVQDFVRDSTLKTFNMKKSDGHWKKLCVKHFTTGETMLTIYFNKQQLSQDIVENEQQSLVNKFKSVDPDIRPTSIYWQTHYTKIIGKPYDTLQHLMGTKYIHEKLLGIKFRVSPDSFFEFNSHATEVLYSTVGELVSQRNRGCHGVLPIVYDLCTDTGSMGIALSKIVPLCKVFIIKSSENRISDAEHNATANGLENVEIVHAGNVKSTLQLLKGRYSESPKIAVVDPQRGGLHRSVIHSIRKSRDIETLIYVSCFPEGAWQNFIHLCRPSMNTLPFKLIKVVPVDAFPNTKHFILVMLFERIYSGPEL